MSPLESLAASALAALFGLCVGSFLHTCIHRVPRGLPVLLARSRCPHCGGTLGVRDLVPLWSYLRLGGRCRRCGAILSRAYPLVELAGAALALAAFWAEGFSVAFFRLFGLAGVFLAVAVVDARHRIVPDAFVAAGLAIAFLGSLGGGPVPPAEAGLGLLVGFAGFALVRAAYRLLRRREGMGMGDVKLAALMGAALGARGWLQAVLLASVAGAAVGVALIRAGRASWGTALPYGAFLSAAAIVLLYWAGWGPL